MLKQIGFITILLVLYSYVAYADSKSIDLSTPEKTLDSYINALREGNIERVLKCYYSEREDFKFHLPSPIKVENYKIVKKTIYTERLASKYVAIPKARAGDVEFDVKEYIDGRKEMFTYLLRHVNQEWRIISHASWNQPD